LVDLSQRSGLTGSLGTLSGLAILRLGGTATTTQATSTAAATAASTTPATGPLAALVTASTLAAAGGTLLSLSRLGLTSKLNRDFALKDLLSRELFDSGGGLVGGSKVHEGVANRTVGTRVHRDGDAFTVRWKMG
jgi:hypothetical protein